MVYLIEMRDQNYAIKNNGIKMLMEMRVKGWPIIEWVAEH